MGTVTALILVLALHQPVTSAVAAKAPVGAAVKNGPFFVLDPDKILQRETFWENRDFAWYTGNLPLLDTPDAALDTTYYYRAELLTRHLVYGSPANGYAFTEFIDRPFWSGQYGAISCPAGLQLAEVRWLRDPRLAWDYARYWMNVPGAKPRKYSTWLADAAWDVHRVHPDPASIKKIYPGLVDNFHGWEKEHFVADKGLFWQTGHDDGMEYNITSRQTKDLMRGAPAYRPTLNAYMWADMRALARMARAQGKTDEAQKWEDRAWALRAKILDTLWDAKREFFFPCFKDREEADGAVVEANTLTYQSGKFAGNPHGRELMGFVPWQFGLPGPKQKAAWKFLADPQYFQAQFGPTTVERRDPQFVLQKFCCFWSGQSWPYATSQTLAALARHLREEEAAEIGREEWFKLFETYTRTHRKNGRPYIAEAVDPFTGSWQGHDAPGHSEHYFHSSYIDLAISGLVGVVPGDGEEIVIDPLAPRSWDHFACDGISCKGHIISVIWDKTGRHYGISPGLAVLVDGKIAAKQETLGKLRIKVDPVATVPPALLVNFACINDGGYFPRVQASTVAPGGGLRKAFDGQFWYSAGKSTSSEGTQSAQSHGLVRPNYWDYGNARRPGASGVLLQHCALAPLPRPTALSSLYLNALFNPLVGDARFYPASALNRWVGNSTESKNPDWLSIDLGRNRTVEQAKIYFVEEDQVTPPLWLQIEGRKSPSDPWVVLARVENPKGRMATTVAIPKTGQREFRLKMAPREGRHIGVSEVELWGIQAGAFQVPPMPAGNLAERKPGQTFPKVTASMTSPYDKVEEVNDGMVQFDAEPRNRWTSFTSKNEKDWIEIDFGKKVNLSHLEIGIYDDGGGVRAPESIGIHFLDDMNVWRDPVSLRFDPELPVGSHWNEVRFHPLVTTKLRVLFTHKGDARSGVTEILASEK